MAMEENETNLIERVCSGDIYAFQEIVERYKKKVYYIAYNIFSSSCDFDIHLRRRTR